MTECSSGFSAGVPSPDAPPRKALVDLSELGLRDP